MNKIFSSWEGGKLWTTMEKAWTGVIESESSRVGWDRNG